MVGLLPSCHVQNGSSKAPDISVGPYESKGSICLLWGPTASLLGFCINQASIDTYLADTMHL